MSEPLYPRLLRLQNVHPNAVQRALLGEGAVAVGVLLSLADLASAWSIVVLPVAVAAVVKAHDVVSGLLPAKEGPPLVEDPPEAQPEPDGVGSDALWGLLWEAQARATAGAEVPFALLDCGDALAEVRAPDRVAAVLTPQERAAALRVAVLDLIARGEAPDRAVLVYQDGTQLVGYEPGLASGIVVAAGDLALVPVDVPNIF